MLSLIIGLLVVVGPVLIAAVVLYWIIRLGVKHGLRSHEREKVQQSEGNA